MAVRDQDDDAGDNRESQAEKGQPFEVTVFGKIIAPTINQKESHRDKNKSKKVFWKRRKNWTFAITFAGVVLAYCLLRETQNQVKIARTAMMSAEEPFVLLEEVKFVANSGYATARGDFVCRFKNFGTTPAFNVECGLTLSSHDDGGHRPGSGRTGFRHLPPGNTEECEMPLLDFFADDVDEGVLGCRVFYRDRFGRWCESAEAVRVRGLRGTSPPVIEYSRSDQNRLECREQKPPWF